MIPDPDDRRPALQPPRFGLGSLLAVVALLGLVFAFAHYVGLYGFVIALLAALCLMAHIAGNAIGTRLRDGERPRPDGSRGTTSARPVQPVSPANFAPATRLRSRYSLGRPVLIVSGVGALVWGVAGALGLDWLTQGKAAWTVLALGAAASAVLGAIWTFAAASFIQVSAGAWFHAANEPRQHESR